MSALGQFLSVRLTVDQRAQIIRDFEKLEADGCIGDCLLRETTEGFLTKYGFSDSTASLTMYTVAFECYRFFANKWLEKKRDDDALFSFVETLDRNG